jgi:predicted ATPase/class 3 adenylate cyclase
MLESTERPVIRSLLLTDLVDSTKMVSELGDERAALVMTRHDRAARDLLAAHGGREIDKSDGFLFLFEQVEDGLRYALAYHNALRELSWTLDVQLSARAGLHTGEVRLISNSAEDVARGAKPLEVEGIAKATAARIMTLAGPGQTLLSSAAMAALGAALSMEAGIRLVRHGWFQMKGVAEPSEVWEGGALGVAPLQPPPDSGKVMAVVRVGDGWRPAREIPSSLPSSNGSFHGREVELRAIADAFQSGDRVVTLCGSGGAGKSLLAIRYASTFLVSWTAGAWFVDLSEARSATAVAVALGRVLNVPLDQGDAVLTLGEALSHRGDLLVVLDTCEQLIQVMGELLRRWSEVAPRVGWLVTSRQRLALRQERLVYVEPLPLPDEQAPASLLAQNPAAALFQSRARAVLPTFSITAENARDVARLVRLLDGLPLAIELAAARVRVLPPKRILERMGRRFDLLAGQRGAGSARQSTLRGAIDWSWGLLSAVERAALAQCAVFEGGFDLEAAEAVLDLSDWPDAPWATDILESLVDQSLLRSAANSEGDTRFTLFRSIQEYALEKLVDPSAIPAASGEAWSGPPARRSIEARHAEHFAGLVDQVAAFHGRDGAVLRARATLELENLSAAVRRAAAAEAADVAARAALAALACLEGRAPPDVGESLASLTLDAGPSWSLRHRVSIALAQLRTRAGQTERAAPLLEAAQAEAAARGEAGVEASARLGLGELALVRGDLDVARGQLSAALPLFRRSGDQRGEARTLAELGHVVGIRGGDFAAGRAFLDESLELQIRTGDQAGEAHCRSHLGALYCVNGDLLAGRAAYEAARELAARLGDRRTEGLCQGMIANIHLLCGDHLAAQEAFERALETSGSVGDLVHETFHSVNYAELLLRLGDIDAARERLHGVLRLARSTGDRLTEGAALGSLGAIEVRGGDRVGGFARIELGEARLREAGDAGELGKLLCLAGGLSLDGGDREAALRRWSEAEDIGARLRLQPEAELALQIGSLGERLRG